MVVTPISAEQPGDATRVLYHRLGAMVLPDEADLRTIGSAIDDVLGDPGIRTRVGAIRETFAAAEREGRAVERLEARRPERCRRAAMP